MENDTKNLPLATSLDNPAKLLGSRGGKKTASKGKEYMSMLGKKGMASRWKHKKTVV